MSASVEVLLDEHGDALRGFVGRHAGFLLRFEDVDDLLQGVATRALERGKNFRARSREESLAWLHTVARSYLADRHAYWAALRRRPSRLLRLTWGAADDEPALDATGPATFAARREQMLRALRALRLLPNRDRELVRWTLEDVPLAEQAERAGLAYKAAERARSRALDRLRGTFRLLEQRGG